jgi:Putative adhesin
VDRRPREFRPDSGSRAVSQVYTGGMRSCVTIAAFVALFTVPARVAIAQRFPFERSFQVTASSKLDVSTVHGKIEVVAGEPGRIVVAGEANVRVGWDVPANAVELARQVAASPPVERAGDTVRLRPPPDRDSQRAVTVSYQVRVPPDTEVRANSDSGATSVRGVAGAVDVRTQSAAIDLGALGGAATVSTGSGAVTVEGVRGPLTVSTSSSAFTGRGVASSLNVRTQSGAIDAALTGAGDVDVETGSSVINLRGVRRGLTAKSQSGAVTVQGAPGAKWIATTGSSSVNVDVDTGIGFSLDASSRSGSVSVDGLPVQGSIAKRDVKGTVNGGGSLVQITSRSGSIRVHVGGP